MDVAEAELARAGAVLMRIPERDGFGDNLIARVDSGGTGDAGPIVVAGHLGTMWPLGTLDVMPYRGRRR